MQDLVRDLRNQSISGREPFENQENVHDSGTESDEEELLLLSDRDFLTKKNPLSFGDPPTLCSSPPPQDTDSKDSFGKESGIHSDGGEHSDREEKWVFKEQCTFPAMSINDAVPMEPEMSTSPRSLRERRCRVRVLVNRRQRQESQSEVELVLRNEANSPSVKHRACKRPALDFNKMMSTRLDAVPPPKRERISCCSSTLSTA